MASAAEALGMTLPGSSSFPAESKEKHDECDSIGPFIRNLLEKNILPRDIMTRSAFENAMVGIAMYFISADGPVNSRAGLDDDFRRLYQRGFASDSYCPLGGRQA